jgi:hypothetical protein
MLRHDVRVAKAKHRIAMAERQAILRQTGGGGNFVEIIFSLARRVAPKSLKKMVVCAVRYEPVSTCNSLLTGNLQGISPILASACQFRPYI